MWGGRLAQGMGVDIRHLGGTGGIGTETASRIFVDGDVGGEAGFGMVAGAVYVSGVVEEPLGNIIEVRSDVAGYRKFVSVTDLLCNHQTEVPVSNSLDPEKLRLVLNDGILRGTLCARCDCHVEVLVDGDAHNGTGLLMRQGRVRRRIHEMWRAAGRGRQGLCRSRYERWCDIFPEEDCDQSACGEDPDNRCGYVAHSKTCRGWQVRIDAVQQV